jgi:hypothetical protein
MVEAAKREESGEARYANYFEVGFTAHEFVLDFGQGYADEQPVAVHTRIVTTPAYAKRFLVLLRKAIEDYDATHEVASETPERG